MEETDIIHAVAHHDQSVQTDVDVEAGVLVRVKSCGTEYVGMRGTAGHDLDPADVLTNAAALTAADQTSHIDLKAGLNEGQQCYC